MEKHQVAMAVNITALQYVVTELAVLLLQQAGEDTGRLREKAQRDLGQWTIAGVKEGWSDHLSAEVHAAVEDLLTGVQARLPKTP